MGGGSATQGTDRQTDGRPKGPFTSLHGKGAVTEYM